MRQKSAQSVRQLPLLQVVGKQLGHVPARVADNTFAAVGLADGLELGVEPVERLEVGGTNVLWPRKELVVVLQTDKTHHSRQLKGKLVVVQNLHEHDLVAIVA